MITARLSDAQIRRTLERHLLDPDECALMGVENCDPPILTVAIGDEVCRLIVPPDVLKMQEA